MKRATLALRFAIVASPSLAADIDDYVGKWDGVGEGSIGADIGRGRAKPDWVVIADECSEHALYEAAGSVGLSLFDRQPEVTYMRKVSLEKVA